MILNIISFQILMVHYNNRGLLSRMNNVVQQWIGKSWVVYFIMSPTTETI